MDDLRFAVRRLLRRPWVTVTATATIALAVGANTAVLSIADAVLFRPLPYHEAERIFAVMMQDRRSGNRFTEVPDAVVRAVTATPGVEAVAQRFNRPSLVIASEDGVRSLSAMAVSGNYFAMLGVSAFRGRVFTPDDVGASGSDRAILLTHAAWQRHFGGRDDLIGRPVTVRGVQYDVVGILPPEFVFPSPFARSDVVMLSDASPADVNAVSFHPIVRIARDRSREEIQTALDAIALATADSLSDANRLTPVLSDVRRLLYPSGGPMMLFLLLAAGAVLLIGCANVSNMLAVNTKDRERDTGIALALGISRRRLVRLAMVEGVLIGLTGAILALAATHFGFELLLKTVPRSAYGTAPVGVDLRVAMISFAIGVFAALLFSAAPIWRESRADVVNLLRGGVTERRGWLRHPMIAVQVSAALVLAFGGILATRALLNVMNAPLGFEPDNVVTITVTQHGLKGTEARDFFMRAAERLRQVPGVVAAGAGGALPLSGRAFDASLPSAAGRPGVVLFLPGYFEATGIPLLHGRLPSDSDVVQGVAMLSESGAKALFGSPHAAVGQSVERRGGGRVPVVGVVGDVRHQIDGVTNPAAYLIPHDTGAALVLVAKVRGTNPDTRRELQRVVTALAPQSPVTAEPWWDTIAATNSFRTPRFQTLVLGSFGAIGLTLTAVGVYGVISFVIARRRREIGVRLALGSPARAVVRIFVAQMSVPIGVGLVLGAIAIVWLQRIIPSYLSGVRADDVPAAIIATVTVLASALLAAYIPARRASQLDPVVTLRQD